MSRSEMAIDARADDSLTATLLATYWHEREATHEYLATPSPGLLEEVHRQVERFAHTAGTLARDERPARLDCEYRPWAGNDRFADLFNRLRSSAGTTLPVRPRPTDSSVPPSPWSWDP